MTIEWLRDLVIIVAGLVFTGTLVFFAILAYLTYRKANSVLTATKSLVETCSQIVQSVMSGAMIVECIKKGLNFFTQCFRGGEEKQ
jgi:hypothetical protein